MEQLQKAYTPEQVAGMLQFNKNTIYDLIGKGEIIAKKFGKAYRIPSTSISFIFTGLDYDIYQAEQEDIQNLTTVNSAIKDVRNGRK